MDKKKENPLQSCDCKGFLTCKEYPKRDLNPHSREAKGF